MDDVGELLEMTRRPGPVIYIGLQGARIVEVTRDFLEYIDQAGERWLIDLHECNNNWCRFFEQNRSGFIIFPGVTEQDIEDEKATMVAARGIRYLQFFDKPKTRFEFASNKARRELQASLAEVGWGTWDSD